MCVCTFRVGWWWGLCPMTTSGIFIIFKISFSSIYLSGPSFYVITTKLSTTYYPQYTIHYTLSTTYYPQYTIHYILSTIHTIHYPLYILSTIHYPLHTIHYILSTIHTIHYPLYILHTMYVHVPNHIYSLSLSLFGEDSLQHEHVLLYMYISDVHVSMYYIINNNCDVCMYTTFLP